MERSSDRSCRQRLGEDTGQVHSRRAGVFPAISTGTRWSLLLPGGGARPRTSTWGPRSQDAPGRGLQSTGSSSKANVGLHRRGVALRTASEPERKKPAKTRAKPKKKVTENSESSSGSSSQAATDTDSMLEQLRKSWLGSGMQKESRKEKARSSSKRRTSGSLCCRRRRKTARASRNQNWM